MSWGESFTAVPADKVASLTPSNIGTPQVEFEVARSLANDAVSSGICGVPTNYTFNVSVNGHVNPNHEPAEGWVNDCVTISVSQATASAT